MVVLGHVEARRRLDRGHDRLPVPLLFIVKQQLRRVPLLGLYMSAMGMIFIRRQQRRRDRL